MKKVRFPRQLVPFSVVATQLVTFAAMLAILIVLSLVFVPRRAAVRRALDPALAALPRPRGRRRADRRVAERVFRDVEHILAAALLPWFFLTPILWSFATLPPSVQSHDDAARRAALGELRRPADHAVRDTLWLGAAPGAADVIYLAVAAVVALALGAYVFSRVDDRIAIEL